MRYAIEFDRELTSEEQEQYDRFIEGFKALDNNNQLRQARRFVIGPTDFAIKARFIVSDEFVALIERNAELLTTRSAELEKIMEGED